MGESGREAAWGVRDLAIQAVIDGDRQRAADAYRLAPPHPRLPAAPASGEPW